MPIYEYVCKKCGNKFEQFMHVNSDLPKCTVCKSDVERLISRFSSVVKGSEHRLLDCVVGEDADIRRSYLEKRRKRKQNKIKE
ncbi:MAG: zinc ribbon domain-containing protein [Candidatus Nanoarchaeia archaeon]|jgi:putative FmdB family regulatory protein|nr:zinc ribbon domain-containing protein [Candidatus Nanoarchaeia archaeon]